MGSFRKGTAVGSTRSTAPQHASPACSQARFLHSRAGCHSVPYREANTFLMMLTASSSCCSLMMSGGAKRMMLLQAQEPNGSDV